MSAVIQLGILVLTRYGWIMDFLGFLWTGFRAAEAKHQIDQKETDVAAKIDTSVAAADDAALDERLRHFQRD